ncbi:MAG: GEVED domain-containing protein, partial [Planctomycetota bacterium]
MIATIRFSYSGTKPISSSGFAMDNFYARGVTPSDTGILVTENASPTILNNIVAGLDTGIDVDVSSSSTVVGGTVYKDNQIDNVGVPPGGAYADTEVFLSPSDPLFVDPSNENFHLAAGSRAIDSSVNSLEDRPELTTVQAPLGVPPSPILAPDLDRSGQLRVDDPDMAPPPGMGLNVFKDRGALDRIDFDGPEAELIVPPDNDAGGIDRNPAPHEVFVTDEVVSKFAIQLSDTVRGIDDNSVTPATVTLLRDGVQLTEGLDYVFSYDATNDVIHLIAAAGVWKHGSIYQIQLDNSTTDGNLVAPIQDLAANPLTHNQQDGTVRFTIQLGGGSDYGDAPDPSYPTLRPAGASHDIVEGFFLGDGVDADADGRPSPGANLDLFDDGVTFDTDVILGGQAQVTVRASAPGQLDAWIDYDGNGVWEAAEQVFVGEALVEGPNTLTFAVPGSATAVAGESFARFRFSTAGGLSPGGAASDGEVEDYLVELISPRWQNPDNNLDVNGDGVLSPQDALVLANFLYFHGQQQAPDGPGTPPFPVDPPPYYDVNGDGFVTVQDGLLVVTGLRNQGAPEGEGEQLPAETTSSSFVSAETLSSSVTVAGIPSTNDRTPADATGTDRAPTGHRREALVGVGRLAAAGGTITGRAVGEPTVASSNRAALAAFFFEETVAPSTALVGIPSINNGEPAAASSNDAASVVDQIMSGTSVANEMDFVDGLGLVDDGSWAATPASDSDA